MWRWDYTNVECFNPNVIYHKCSQANIRSASVHDHIIRNLYTLCPAGVIPIVVFTCIVIGKSDGSDRERGFSGGCGSSSLVRIRS